MDQTDESLAPQARRLLDRSDPDLIIHWLEYACENRNVDLYGLMLRDSYRFEFDPQDYDFAGVEPDAPWWPKAVDVNSTAAMFENLDVIGLTMDLMRVSSWERCTDSVSGLEGFCARFEPDIKLTVEKESYPVIIYWVFRTWLDITVVADAAADGDLQIVHIKETVKPTKSFAGTEPMTWGQLKSMYR